MATTGISASPLSEAEHSRQLRRAIVAGTVGTIIEAYDFLLYVQVAPLVFAHLFFPVLRSVGRNLAGLRHLRRRLCLAPGRRRAVRALRRPDRAQGNPDRDPAC